MASLLPQLKDRQSLLLMYQAGELPQEDQAEVRRMLESDPELRRSLEELGELHRSLAQDLRRLDESSRLPRSAASASQQVARLLEQRRLQNRATARPKVGQEQHGGRPWWVYSSAVAAAVVLAVSAWMVYRPVQSPVHVPVALAPQQQVPAPSAALQDELASALVGSFGGEYAEPSRLDEADRLLVSLWDASDDVPSFLSVDDASIEGPVEDEIQ